VKRYLVYADVAVVVEIEVEAESPAEALAKGDGLFERMSDETILRRGSVGAPLAGAVEVRDRRGRTVLEKCG